MGLIGSILGREDAGYAWVLNLIKDPSLATQCEWGTLLEADWNLLMLMEPSVFDDEEIQLKAVAVSSLIIQYLNNPCERVRRMHEIKWKL